MILLVRKIRTFWEELSSYIVFVGKHIIFINISGRIYAFIVYYGSFKFDFVSYFDNETWSLHEAVRITSKNEKLIITPGILDREYKIRNTTPEKKAVNIDLGIFSHGVQPQ